VSSVLAEWSSAPETLPDGPLSNPEEPDSLDRVPFRVTMAADTDATPATLHPAGDADGHTDTLKDEHRLEVRPVRTKLPVKRASRAATEPLQEWEGVVSWIDGDSFGGRLFDLTEPGELEEMEFSVDEVSRDDLGLLVPGAVFYWTIARHTNEVGTRTNVSILRFRRLPARSKRSRGRAAARAAALSDQLGID